MNGTKDYPLRFHRKSMRLDGYDYSQEGSYFITIVTKNREPLFGEVTEGEMVMSEFGKVVEEEWIRSGQIRNEIELDDFVVMPNHFHAIVHIFNNFPDHTTVVGAYGHTPLQKMPFRSPARSLGALVRGFKSSVTTRVNQVRNTPGVPIWQRNYYDPISQNSLGGAKTAAHNLHRPRI